MRRLTLLFSLLTWLSAHTAWAESLSGRVGVTARAGAMAPVKDDFIGQTSGSNAGVVAGGGFIVGVGNNFAAEFEVLHAPGLDVEISGAKAFEAKLTDVALSLQYRFAPQNHLVPFLGAGVDFITGELKHVSGAEYDLEWTEGGHVNAGFDYFITNGIAVTTDVRGIFAFDGDITGGAGKVGTYRPLSFVATLGVRLILPPHVFRGDGWF